MHKSSPFSSSQVGATAALAGVLLLFMGTFLHPSSADPNDAIASFPNGWVRPLWYLRSSARF